MAATLLAIDTSSEWLALGLATPQGVLGATLAGGPQASARLLAEVQQLLDRAGLPIDRLDGIAFGRGPGAFTGLRTACSVAQGLAMGLGCPLLPVDSLLIVAEDARRQRPLPARPGWVAVDARMDEVYAGCWTPGADGGWVNLVPPALFSVAALADAWHRAPPAWVAGNAIGVFGGRLPLAGADTRAEVADRAAALVALAARAWEAGERLDPADALPLYLRDKVALTTAERQAARAAEASS